MNDDRAPPLSAPKAPDSRMALSRRSVLSALPGGLAAAALLTSPVKAAPSKRVNLVELFTSQGCSSCPAADALMVRLADDPTYIPLTFPVEIWDYLGWKDTLARPDFTRRQKAYAGALSNRKVYTPQAIVNGRASCVGSDRATISRLSTVQPARAGFTIDKTGDGWQFSAVLADSDAASRLILVPISGRQTIAIGRGENSGRSITYANVARGISDLGAMLKGMPLTGAVTMEALAKSNADGFVLIAQAGSLAQPGEGFGAALVTQSEIRL